MNPKSLLNQGYDAVCVTAGLWKPIELGIENEHLGIRMVDLLSNPSAHITLTGRVAVIGGGATALGLRRHCPEMWRDGCGTLHARKAGRNAAHGSKERKELIDFDIEVNGRTRVSKINGRGQGK
jgi:hypothetical protein